MEDQPLYETIYNIVRQIPAGKVATYGQIARITGRCTARMVGYAMSALKSGNPKYADVPWQRVINSQGKVSVHGYGIGTSLQRQLLEEEGVVFDREGKVNFEEVGWLGPDGTSTPR